MRRVTKENLIAQIDRLRKIKDEQGQLSMNGEYTLQAYEILLAMMEVEPVVPGASDDIGKICVGSLTTMNQDDYPGLGDWWVQLRIGEDCDEVLARVYGATPQEARSRAEALVCRTAILNQK